MYNMVNLLSKFISLALLLEWIDLSLFITQLVKTLDILC